MNGHKLFIYLFGVLIRLSLMKSSLVSVIQDRVEISTPLNSWIRVKEGIFLYNQELPVYSGGIYHGSPLELLISAFLLRFWNNIVPVIFIAMDITTALLLSSMASCYSRNLFSEQEKEKEKYSKEGEVILLLESDNTRSATLVAIAYLFSPYIVASCVAQATSIFNNLLLAAALLTMVKGYFFFFGVLLAFCTYQAFYPVCLLVPGVMEAINKKKSPLRLIISYFCSLIGLIYLSFIISGSWKFLEATYGFMLSAPDLTPNIGLFWYFFTEMFEHFRLFFLCTFQINAFIYVLPLAVKLRKDPTLLALSLLALTAVFRSYPCLSDVGFYMSLLPIWRHLYSYLRQTFLVGCMLVATSVLGPIMYNLWIFNGSANANFYFAVTLAFNTAQIFLVTDLLFAHVKQQFHLYHGSKQEIDGQPATLVLESIK